ncbi:MAG TPA: hypothetical protein OIM12_01175 [Faecalibacterium prausnitzii]|nr:hypothetical protein [Faecalibacterium prausnitzii]
MQQRQKCSAPGDKNPYMLQHLPCASMTGFSTHFNIRQNDVGENCKSGQFPVQKIVIIPT